MRLYPYTCQILLFSLCISPSLQADVTPLDAQNTQQISANLRSEFQFQSGDFAAAFQYYERDDLSTLSAKELWRGYEIANVLGRADWQANAVRMPAFSGVHTIASLKKRMQWAIEDGNAQVTQAVWREFLQLPNSEGVFPARSVIEFQADEQKTLLIAALKRYVEQRGLSESENLELFIYASLWRENKLAQRLQARLPAKSAALAMSKTVTHCIVGTVANCILALAELEPQNYYGTELQTLQFMANKTGDNTQQARWLNALPQTANTLSERIELLSKKYDEQSAKKLLLDIEKNIELNDLQRTLMLASVAEVQKNWSLAESLYKKALNDSESSVASIRLALVLLQQNKSEQAIIHLRDVQKNKKLASEIQREAFLLHLEILRRDTKTPAITIDTLYQQAIAQWPSTAQIRYQYSMYLFSQDKKPLALQELLRVIEQSPAHVDALNAYGYTLADDFKQAAKAMPYVEKAYLLAPQRGDVLDSYGYVLATLGMQERALTHLKKAWQLTPSAVIAEHLAQTYLHLSDIENAKDVVQKGLKLDADNSALLALQAKLP